MFKGCHRSRSSKISLDVNLCSTNPSRTSQSLLRFTSGAFNPRRGENTLSVRMLPYRNILPESIASSVNGYSSFPSFPYLGVPLNSDPFRNFSRCVACRLIKPFIILWVKTRVCLNLLFSGEDNLRILSRSA